jgi:hypothetical protein
MVKARFDPPAHPPRVGAELEEVHWGEQLDGPAAAGGEFVRRVAEPGRRRRGIAAGHAFVQNLRRGHYELATDVSPALRLATTFTELALAI